MSFATYAEISKGVSSEETYPRGITFNSDGSKMYFIGYGVEFKSIVHQYTLSTPWDISTATYDSKSKDVSSEDEFAAYDVAFNSDGSKMYIVGVTSHTIFQYTLSTPWDISTATYDSKSKDVGSQENEPIAFAFNSDGSKMYFIGTVSNTIFQYTLSTPWDISTATYDSKSKDVSSEDESSIGIAFNSTGQKMYIVGFTNAKLYEYKLTVAWDISSASYTDRNIDVSDEDATPGYIAFNNNRTKMYIMGTTNKTIYQYTITSTTISTNSATDIATTSVTANGEITALGVETITTRGFKYGLTKTNTWDVHNDGDYEIGTFNKGLTLLSVNTIYWIRAYIVDSTGTSYGEWVQFQTAVSGTTPSDTRITLVGDASGYVSQMHAAETDLGVAYEGYFVLATDLSQENSLMFKKRLLDLDNYFRAETAGTVTISVKCDHESLWRELGDIDLTGSDDIVIPHLAVDESGKHFLIKFAGENVFRYLGTIFQYLVQGVR